MRDLAEIQAFMALYKHQSLTRAAKALALPKSTLSRRLSHLEEDLGQALAIRDGRGLQLTEAGQVFAIYCQQLLELADLGRNALRELQEDVSGTLKIAVHSALKRGWLMQVLDEFMSEHPGIRLEVYTQNLDAGLADTMDLWFWLGELPRGRYRREQLGSWAYGLFAAPEYLQRRGRPQAPEDLMHHQWVDLLGMLKKGLHLHHPNQGSYPLMAFDSRWKTDSLVLQIDAIQQGRGLGFLPLWQADCFEAAHPGRLQRCLDAWQTGPVDIALYYPLGRPTRRMTLLLQALRQQCPQEWKAAPRP